jgi:hypothetical protein
MCVIEIDTDGYRASFYHDDIVTARKQRKCHECYRPIIPGQKYERTTGKWDGQFDRVNTCLPCREIRNRFMCSWQYGEVWESIREYFRDGDFGDLDGLSLEAIDFMQEQFQERWDDLNNDEGGI